MAISIVPILLAAVAALGLSVVLLGMGCALGPRRSSRVKEMPYESGMDPIRGAHRRFDVRFHLVAIAFLVFDVELLFLYPWAVASKAPEGIDAAVAAGLVSGRGLVFAEVMVFLAMLAVGWVYVWRKGVFRWR